MEDPSTHWAARAEYDFSTAQAVFRSRRYLYVLFCCQQAVEKMIKRIIVERTGELPPRVHSLFRHSGIANLSPNDEQLSFLGELSAYYIQSRYPEEIGAIATCITRGIASDTLRHTEEILEWLRPMPQ